MADRGCSVVGLTRSCKLGPNDLQTVSRMFLEWQLQQDQGPQSLERSVSAPSGEVCSGSCRLKLASLGLESPLHPEALPR